MAPPRPDSIPEGGIEEVDLGDWKQKAHPDVERPGNLFSGRSLPGRIGSDRHEPLTRKIGGEERLLNPAGRVLTAAAPATGHVRRGASATGGYLAGNNGAGRPSEQRSANREDHQMHQQTSHRMGRFRIAFPVRGIEPVLSPGTRDRDPVGRIASSSFDLYSGRSRAPAAKM